MQYIGNDMMKANGTFEQSPIDRPVETDGAVLPQFTPGNAFRLQKSFSRKIVWLYLMLGLALLLPRDARAQTFSKLHDFLNFGNDGGSPYAELLMVGNTLYGTALGKGTGGYGTVFAVNPDGTGFRVLHHFSGGVGGASPQSGLVLAGDTLYGTTRLGGAGGNGSVFAVSTNGTGFTVLHAFAASGCDGCPNSDGANPVAGLVLSGGTLYGTAEFGGINGKGTVFRINTDGSGFTPLHHFTAVAGLNGSNADGARPRAGLVLSGNILYGAASEGGSAGNGTLFKINTDGTGFVNLFDFALHPDANWTNTTGINPHARLILSGSTLYGTAFAGGSFGNGTVFKVNIDGTGFTVVHHFSAASGNPWVNTDGTSSSAPLVLVNNTLYGTAVLGGQSGYGTVFKVRTDGTDFAPLHHFSATSGIRYTNSDGAYPNGGLIFSGGNLYGTAHGGGASGYGSLFRVAVEGGSTVEPPLLSITRSGSNVIVSWTTNAVGFNLQSSTTLTAGDWVPVLEAPAVVGSEFQVTTSAQSPHRFFRLMSPGP